VPRVRIRIPSHVLSQLHERAEEQEARDELWVKALSAYVERKGTTAPQKPPSYNDRMRRDAFQSARMPQTAVEVSDELFGRADKLAKRLHKTRELLYSEAMAEFLQGDLPPEGGGHH